MRKSFALATAVVIAGWIMESCMSAVLADAPSPSTISGLQLWLSSDQFQGSTDGTAVMQWNDVSGNNRHASAVTVSPTIGEGTPFVRNVNINGTFTRVVSFEPVDGSTADQLNTTWDPAKGNYTIFAVGATTDTVGAFIAHDDNGWNNLDTNFGVGNVSSLSSPAFPDGSLALETHGPTTGEVRGVSSGTTSVNDGEWHVLMGLADGTLYQVAVDGESPFSLTSDQAGIFGAGTTPNRPVQIGNTQSTTSNRSFNGDLAEVLIFSGALSDEQINQVGFYLQDKYSLDSSFIDPNPAAAVPEPSSLAAMIVASLFALAGAAILRRRKGRRCA